MISLTSVRESLSFLGLTPQATACYEVLTRIPSDTVAGIAKRAKLHRPTVYRELSRLQERGLVETVSQGKRTHFKVTPPKQLEALIQDRTTFLTEAFQSLPASTSMNASQAALSDAEGLRSIQSDIVRTLPRGGTFLRISMRKAGLDASAWTDPDYARLRGNGRLQVIDIVNPGQRENPCKAQLECVFRLLPRECDHVPFQGALFVYGERIAFADYEGQSGVIIENPVFAAFLEKVFRVLFNVLPSA
jgi:predicted transcriptional regulator